MGADYRIEEALARHERVAFQFSGGRDSTAALYLLRPYWAYMTVYHVDAGEQFPETREVVQRVFADLFADGAPLPQVLLCSSAATRREIGLPSDLVPVDNLPVGQLLSGRRLKLTSRFDCCWRTLMLPMHQRMLADGITLIVRGQRNDEFATTPLRSGDQSDGFELLYPIEDWTGEQVSEFLKANDLPVAPFYERGMRRAPECMGCTAWWDEGRAAYMREWHPIAFAKYQRDMRAIRAEVDRQYQFMRDEMEGPANGA